MHHYRVTLNGPRPAVARLVRELTARGAVALTGCSEEVRVVWCGGDGPGELDELSRRHPAVTLGVECFEALGRELLRAVVEQGTTTVLERRALERCCDDEERAEPLDDALLRDAAGLVGAVDVVVGGGLGTGAESAVCLGAAFGDLCRAASQTLRERDAECGAPLSAGDAVLALAASALTVGAARWSMCAAELEFERALLLARARFFAATEPLWARPGQADWVEWLAYLAAAVGDAVEAAFACDWMGGPELPVMSEHLPNASERFEVATRTLLSTCLQVLVLFGDQPRDDRAEGTHVR